MLFFYFHSPVEVGLFPLYVNGVERVQPEPRGEREPVLVRPLGQGWKDDGLKAKLRY